MRPGSLLIHGAFGRLVVLGARDRRPRGRRPQRRGDRPPRIAGSDPTPLADVTLDLYAQRICAVLADGPPALLVGQSMGGMVDHAGGRTVSGAASLRWPTSRPSFRRTGRACVDLTAFPEAAGDQVQANIVVDGDPPIARMPAEAAPAGALSLRAARAVALGGGAAWPAAGRRVHATGLAQRRRCAVRRAAAGVRLVSPGPRDPAAMQRRMYTTLVAIR